MESSTPLRLVFVILGWALFMAAMVLLANLLSPSFGQVMKVILIFGTLIGVTMLGVGWTWGQLSNVSKQESTSEVLRRNRLTMALRDLSDEELIRLRQRLSNGDIDDHELVRLMDESDANKAKPY